MGLLTHKKRGMLGALQRIATGGALCFCIASCATVDPGDPAPYQTEAMVERLGAGQPAPLAPIDLHEALARGMLYNAPFRAQRLKAFQAFDEVGLSQADYLPRVSAFVTTNRRSNIQASVGQRVDQMGEDLPTDFFTATDRSRTFGGLSASWNIIDFGLAYLENEKQKRWAETEHYASQLSCSTLVGDIVTTHWRARAFARAEAKNAWLRWRVESGLAASRKRAETYPSEKTFELLLQRELIDLFRWYDSIYQSLAGSKAELAGLMNLPAGQEFDVELAGAVEYLDQLPESDVELIKLAFENRVELRQRQVLEAVNRISDRQSFVRLFPSLSVLFGAEADSNSFLLNSQFTSLGATLSWNLFELTRLKDRARQTQARDALFDLETQLIASAIASQVAMSVSEYRARDKTLNYAWRANTIQAEIADRKRAEFEAGTAPEAHLVKEELLRELSILRRDVDEAGHQAARIRVLNAVGLGPDCSTLQLGQGVEAVREQLSSQSLLLPAEPV